MRISQIRSPKALGWFAIDQLAHAAIVLAVVAWWAESPGEVASAGVILLGIREAEQARDTVEAWWHDRTYVYPGAPKIPGIWWLLKRLHLPDRTLDITLGAAIASIAFQLYATLLS